MKRIRPTWNAVVLLCTNEREAGSGQVSCGRTAGTALRRWLRDRLRERGVLDQVMVSVSGCLGVCPRDGITVAVLPAVDSNEERAVWIVEPSRDRKELLENVLRHCMSDSRH